MTKPALDLSNLPEDPQARREILEERATPSSTRPQLPPKIERQLARTEEETAQCYLQNEEITFRMYQLARAISELPVPEYIEEEDTLRIRLPTSTTAPEV